MMNKLGKLRKEERENLLEKAEHYLKILRERTGPLSGIVFGSVSRGDFNYASDVDLLVIAEELPSHPLRRIEILLSPWVPGVDPKGYTPSEFKALKLKKNPFILSVLQEGIILLDDLGIFQNKSVYEDVEETIRNL